MFIHRSKQLSSCTVHRGTRITTVRKSLPLFDVGQTDVFAAAIVLCSPLIKWVERASALWLPVNTDFTVGVWYILQSIPVCWLIDELMSQIAIQSD